MLIKTAETQTNQSTNITETMNSKNKLKKYCFLNKIDAGFDNFD